MEAAIADAVARTPEMLIVDLSETMLIDSPGITAPVRAHRRAFVQSVGLAMIPAPDRVHAVFALCGLDSFLPFTLYVDHATRCWPEWLTGGSGFIDAGLRPRLGGDHRGDGGEQDSYRPRTKGSIPIAARVGRRSVVLRSRTQGQRPSALLLVEAATHSPSPASRATRALTPTS